MSNSDMYVHAYIYIYIYVYIWNVFQQWFYQNIKWSSNTNLKYDIWLDFGDIQALRIYIYVYYNSVGCHWIPLWVCVEPSAIYGECSIHRIIIIINSFCKKLYETQGFRYISNIYIYIYKEREREWEREKRGRERNENNDKTFRIISFLFVLF